MANGPLLRVSNVLGTPVFQWVINQLKTRSDNNSKDTRDDSNLIYLANKTGWFRIVSSVRIPEFTATTSTTSKTYDYFRNKYSNDIKDQDSLAKKYVLFAGTSAYEKSETGDAFSYRLQQPSYGILGDEEIKAYGRRPMPGITSVQIDTQGALGSIRSATINFKVWDKEQLDIIDALYFKLGYTMFLEWGNTFYYKTGASKISKSEDLQIDPFSKTLNTKEQINLEIQKKIRQSEGNYDGMLGLVTNFNFTFNQEGGYDCSLRVQGLGSLGDSIKINHSSALPALYVNKVLRAINEQNEKKQLDLKSTSDKDLQDKTTAILDKQKKDIDNLQINIPFLALLLNSGEIELTADLQSYINSYNYNKDSYNAIQTILDDYERSHAVWGDAYYIITSRFKKNLDTVYFPDLEKYVSSKDPLQTKKISVTLDVSSLNEFVTKDGVKDIWQYIKQSNNGRLDYSIGDAKNLYFSWTKNTGTINEGAMLDDLTSGNIQPTFQLKNVNVDLKSGKDYSEIQLSYPYDTDYVTIDFNDASLVKDITYTSDFKDLTKLEIDQAEKKRIEKAANAEILALQKQTAASYNQQKVDLQKSSTDVTSKQTQEATNLQSAIEIMLKTIQLEAYNYAQKKEFKDVFQFDLTTIDKDTKKSFIDGLFSEGIFDGKITNLLKKVEEINSAKTAATTDPSKLELDKKYQNQSPTEQFLINAAFGFNHNFMSGLSNVASTPTVKYKNVSQKGKTDHALFNAYILPQNVNGEIERGSLNISHPVYIPFGLLLMMINHICLIYDGSSQSQLTPMVYVDYNPNTNFCLTNAKQLSTDITKFLVGFQGADKDYQELFDKSVLSIDGKTKGNGKLGTEDIWSPENDDFLSGKIPEFKKNAGTSYQGQLMNVLVNLNYVTKLIAEFSYRDGTNSVYLKQFLEQVLVDMNKSLGNFNMLRLSYHDPSNAFVIVDDQQTKVADGEIQLTGQNSNISDLPIFGKKSIAKSIEIRTDISNKLNSLIAISANSDTGRQVSLSTDASSFGFINTDFQDRFISIATDIYTDKKKKGETSNPAILNEAQKFDGYIRSIYETANRYDESLISSATNYYIQKMSTFKNKEEATRASAMIPVSLNMSLDGISGFQMTQLFTIGENFLPYNYIKKKDGNKFTTVGFAIVGLTHTIENNQWTTSLRTNMAHLRNNVNDYEANKAVTTYSDIKPKSLPAYVGTNSTNYPKILFINNVDVSVLNPNLLQDINDAASIAGVTVSIGFGVEGHTKGRHVQGNAVDINLINGQVVSPAIKTLVETFTDELAKKGYRYNAEFNGTEKYEKAYLTFDFLENGKRTHEDHVHVSRLT